MGEEEGKRDGGRRKRLTEGAEESERKKGGERGRRDGI